LFWEGRGFSGATRSHETWVLAPEGKRTERRMVVLAVTWMAKIGRESEVAAIFEQLTAESRKEPGCLMYQVHKHKTDPRRFFIYEQYKDDAALEAHRTTPHFLQMAKKDLPKIADRTEGHLFEPLG
jgi:(4S)-4-hydroxy-5-phosphonooxypentane-2,3-dione isomerase